MQERLEIGSRGYIIESNRIITEVMVTAIRGEFCTLRFLNGGAIRLRKSRVFMTKEEAKLKLPRATEAKHRHRTPYDYEM